MECNKEEALRAKGIAESKMQNADFSGAHKIALKAQKLYSELENISQMLVVCDVHCVADKKLFGNELDWYSILQVEQTADEGAIKKQYRKLALQLHPDKNKFPGAEAAFKLIGEAQRVLLDQGKRALHDMKRRACKSAAPYRPSNVGMQNNVRNNFVGVIPQPQPRPPPAHQGYSSNGRPTFWTTCPFCKVKYQFYKEVLHKSITCQNCAKSFVAYEGYGPECPRPPAFTQPVFPQPKIFPNQGNTVPMNSKPACRTQGKPGVTSASAIGVEKTSSNRKRKQVVESSSESSDDEDLDRLSKMNADGSGGGGGQSQRRSERRRQNVSYDENVSDDDGVVAPTKKAKGNRSSGVTDENISDVPEKKEPKTSKESGEAAEVKEENASFEKVIPNGKEHDDKMNIKKTTAEDVCNGTSEKKENADADSLSDLNDAKDPETYLCPDPDFNDFDKNREVGCFAVGQMWAVYDTLDAMPRFYAHIKKVFSSGFKVRITWLEPDPDDENEMKWADEDLPVSCGKYKCGKSENVEDLPMFSHLMNWERGRAKNTFKIFPIKGETWALFKNWNIGWSSDADENRKYKYEFVEVLSEYKEGVGVSVAYLAKVKGFVSLFCRMDKDGKNEIQITSDELFRFAHRVPSFQLTGEERAGVPKGSFELDPACLPTDLLEIDTPADMKPEINTQQSESSESSDETSDESSDYPKPTTQSKERASSDSSEGEAKANRAKSPPDVIDIEEDSASPNNDAFEIPEPEFFNFDEAKSPTKFQVDQIWSLYCLGDGLPKYYAQIKKIELTPKFKLHICWLEACSQQKGLIQWHDKEMPSSCGRFKVMVNKKREQYTSVETFSHLSNAEPAGKKNEYDISPKKDEVWALYRNWSAEMKFSDLLNCEFDIVEVLSKTAQQITVHSLERVNGFNTVYKIQIERKLPVTKVIPLSELLRFSHRIPFFRLTSEGGGSLRGFLELDPGALPVHQFST